MGLVFGTNKLKTSHLQFLQFGADEKLFVSLWKINKEKSGSYHGFIR